MSERALPEPDRYASCPGDGRILEYYHGQFDAVFVLLHPFIKPRSIDPSRFSGIYPQKAEIISGCAKVSWAEVISLGGFATIAEIDIGLRSSIVGLVPKYARPELSRKLDSLAEAHGIFQPAEGDVPPLLQNDLFSSIQDVGYTWLWVGDESCTERELLWIEDLKESDVCHGHCNLFTPDKSILLTTHWDSHFSFLCGSRSLIDRILAQRSFEGFFCSAETEVYWSLRNKCA